MTIALIALCWALCIAGMAMMKKEAPGSIWYYPYAIIVGVAFTAVVLTQPA